MNRALAFVAGLAVVASAASPAAASRATVRAHIEAVTAGAASMADVADPAVGVAIRDEAGTMRACHRALEVFADAIDRAVRDRQVRELACRRRGGRTVCRLELEHSSGGGEHNFALAFAERSSGLVLEAAVWKSPVSTADVDRAIRRAPSGCPAAPATAGEPPADPDRPRQVTRALIPAPATCELFEGGEYASGMRFQFRTTGSGLVLDAIVTVSSVYRPFDVEARVARLRIRPAERCP